MVVLTTDDEIKKKKGYTPELSFEERKEILESIRYVKEVVAGPWLITDEFMDSVNFNFSCTVPITSITCARSDSSFSRVPKV